MQQSDGDMVDPVDSGLDKAGEDEASDDAEPSYSGTSDRGDTDVDDPSEVEDKILRIRNQRVRPVRDDKSRQRFGNTSLQASQVEASIDCTALEITVFAKSLEFPQSLDIIGPGMTVSGEHILAYTPLAKEVSSDDSKRVTKTDRRYATGYCICASNK